jgi:endo-1,4-beta-xylanase
MSRCRLCLLAWVLAIAFFLGGCQSGSAPTATAPPDMSRPTTVPSATPDPTATPGAVEWVTLEGAQALLHDPMWACVSGGQVVDGRLAFQAGADYLTVVNAQGPHIEFEDDVGLFATLEVVSGDWAAFTICGALSDGAWWQGIKRLDLSWSNGQVGFLFWDGTSELPLIPVWFAAPDASGKAQIGLRKHGDRLIITVDGTEVGQVDDPGLFPDNRAYLGATVKTNCKLVIHEIGVEAVKGQESTVQIVSPPDTAVYVPSSPALRELAEARGVAIGAAVAPGPLRCEPAYAGALGHEFNILTTENAMKFGPIHPEPDRYSFDDADAIVDFAEAHDMLVRGHTLVWHQQLPSWVEEGQWTREELMEVLHEHITTVVGRYRGRVDAWDVVNEAIESGGLRNTVWQRVIGPEYIELAFRWAHEADPDALLFYNDYACEELCSKSDAIYSLVKNLVDQGIPIHGVGLQTHISVVGPPDPQSVAQNIRRFNELGLDVHITELDVRMRGEPADRQLERQADIYRDLMKVCLSADRCTAFVMWGFTDRHSWIPASHAGWGSALIFDEAYRPKPAYDALRDALATP